MPFDFTGDSNVQQDTNDIPQNRQTVVHNFSRPNHQKRTVIDKRKLFTMFQNAEDGLVKMPKSKLHKSCMPIVFAATHADGQNNH